MGFITTKSGKQFNPRDFISFLKYTYAADPRKYGDKTAFQGAADAVRGAFQIGDYKSTDELDSNFDYNKIDWNDVNDTVASWSTGADPNMQKLAATLSPYLTGAKSDTGIYKLGELQNEAASVTATGELDAQIAQWQSVLNGEGSKESLKALDDNKALALSTMTEMATLMKKQIETSTASGRLQIEADYAGVTDEILAGVAKLQAMTVDDWAARGMAFSGPMQRAQADIGAAGAAEIGKAMAQKGARLGKLANDLIAYTAQIDIDVLQKNADVVMQYGLQRAALLDKDAGVRQEATAMLAGLGVKKETLKTLTPLQSQISNIQTEQSYDSAKAAEATAAEEKQYDRRMNSAQLEAQYGIVMDESGRVIATHPTFEQSRAMMNDAAQLMGAYGISVKMVNGKPVITDSMTTGETVSLGNLQLAQDEFKWKKERALFEDLLNSGASDVDVDKARTALLKSYADELANENLPVSVRENANLLYQTTRPQLGANDLENVLYGSPSYVDKDGKQHIGNKGILSVEDPEEAKNLINSMGRGSNQLLTALLYDLKDGKMSFSDAYGAIMGDPDTEISSSDRVYALRMLANYAGIPVPSQETLFNSEVAGTGQRDVWESAYDSVNWEKTIKDYAQGIGVKYEKYVNPNVAQPTMTPEQIQAALSNIYGWRGGK